MIIVKGRVSRSVNGMVRSHPYPIAFTDVKFCTTGVHKIQLSEWVLLMQMAVSLQGGAAVRTRVNHGEAVKVALLVRCGMGFQGFDDEPLVGIGLAYLSPEHVVSFSAVVACNRSCCPSRAGTPDDS